MNHSANTDLTKGGDSDRKTAALGLFSRKQRWGLTWRGWLALMTVACAGFFTVLFNVHPFLAVTNPLPGDVLVIEGWIPEYALKDCGEVFRQQSYSRILTVGGPVRAASYPAAYDDTYAYVAARRLQKLGLDKAIVHMVPTNLRTRDRTYSSAVAVREWLSKTNRNATTLTVATLGPHARRTRLMYEKAFGPSAKIGIVSVPNREYDARRWWKYSEGVKEVVSEGGAYLYARFLFRPAKNPE